MEDNVAHNRICCSKKIPQTLINQGFTGHLAEKERFELSLRFTRTTPLAGEPLRPLGYFSMSRYAQWENGGERGIRTPGACASLVFKTSAINRSAISPRPRWIGLSPKRLNIISPFQPPVNPPGRKTAAFSRFSPRRDRPAPYNSGSRSARTPSIRASDRPKSIFL